MVKIIDNTNIKKTFNPKIIPASITDYPTIQNLARFYIYDMSRYCGFISKKWACPTDGLYNGPDFKKYFDDPTRKAFLIYVGDELAGFILINKVTWSTATDWNIGEFFILAKFQGKCVASQAAKQLWKIYPGQWEVCVIPQNTRALAFWRKTITEFTNNTYNDAIRNVDFDQECPARHILTFSTRD